MIVKPLTDVPRARLPNRPTTIGPVTAGDASSADVGLMRLAAVMAGFALAAFMGSRALEWWSLHRWFDQTISNPGTTAQPWDPNWNLIEHATGVLWMLAAVAWCVVTLTGFEALRRRVARPRWLVIAGASLLLLLPGAVSIGFAGPSRMRPDELLTADFVSRLIAVIGGLVVAVYAARQPRATQER